LAKQKKSTIDPEESIEEKIASKCSERSRNDESVLPLDFVMNKTYQAQLHPMDCCDITIGSVKGTN